MDWNEIEDDCFQIMVELVNKILSEHPDEKFYAFSLYTDSSAMTVSLSANTEEKLNAMFDADADKSQLNQNYYRWAVSEWAYEGYGADFFNEVSRKLRLAPGREHFSDFRCDLIKSLTNALNRMNKEIMNDTLVVMFVSITDDDESEFIENMSSELINSEAMHDAFLERYE